MHEIVTIKCNYQKRKRKTSKNISSEPEPAKSKARDESVDRASIHSWTHSLMFLNLLLFCAEYWKKYNKHLFRFFVPFPKNLILQGLEKQCEKINSDNSIFLYVCKNIRWSLILNKLCSWYYLCGVWIGYSFIVQAKLMLSRSRSFSINSSPPHKRGELSHFSRLWLTCKSLI